MKHRKFVTAWLWFFGLAGLSLPFLWWPKPFGWLTFTHAVVFIAALGWVVRGGEEGRIFDSKRSHVRGYAAVLAYAAVIFSGIFSYRAFIL